jgi:hypothetical protein
MDMNPAIYDGKNDMILNLNKQSLSGRSNRQCRHFGRLPGKKAINDIIRFSAGRLSLRETAWQSFEGYELIWNDGFDNDKNGLPDPDLWYFETGDHGWGNTVAYRRLFWRQWQLF